MVLKRNSFISFAAWNYHSRIVIQNISKALVEKPKAIKETTAVPSSTNLSPVEVDLEVASDTRSYQVAEQSPNNLNTFGDFPSFDQVHKENENKKMYSIQQNYAENTASIYNSAVNVKFQNQKFVPYVKQVRPERPSIALQAIHQTGIFEVTDEKHQPPLPARFQDSHKYIDLSVQSINEQTVEPKNANWHIAAHHIDSDGSSSNVNNAHFNRNAQYVKPTWHNHGNKVRKPTIVAPAIDVRDNIMEPVMKPSLKDWVGDIMPGGSVEDAISTWDIMTDDVPAVVREISIPEVPEPVKNVKEEVVEDYRDAQPVQFWMDPVKTTEGVQYNWMDPVKATEVREYMDSIKESWRDRTNPSGFTDLGGIKTTLMSPKNHGPPAITEFNIKNSWKSNNRPTRPAINPITATKVWMEPNIKFVPMNDKDTAESIKTIFVPQPMVPMVVAKSDDWVGSMKPIEDKKNVVNVKLGGIINNIDDSMAMETQENLNAIISTWIAPPEVVPTETENYPKIEDIMEVTNKTVEVNDNQEVVQTTWLVKKKPMQAAERRSSVRIERRQKKKSQKEASSSIESRPIRRNFQPRVSVRRRF